MLNYSNDVKLFYRNKRLASDLTRRHIRTDIGTPWSKSVTISSWFLLVCCWTYIHHRNVHHSANLRTDNLPFAGQYHPWECCRMWSRQWCATVGCFDGITKHCNVWRTGHIPCVKDPQLQLHLQQSQWWRDQVCIQMWGRNQWRHQLYRCPRLCP